MKQLIFVVDMINGFCKKGALADASIMRIVPEIRKRLDQTPREQVWFVCDTHSEQAAEFEQFPPHCVQGTEEAEIISELAEYADSERTICKNSVNAFLAIADPAALFSADVDQVWIMGCCTDICIQNFAITLKHYLNQVDRHTEVVVDLNTVETFDSPNHSAAEARTGAVAQMRANGVTVRE